MPAGKRTQQPPIYLGVDIGGTKIQAALVEQSGKIIAREKYSTPRSGGTERTVSAIEKAMQKVVSRQRQQFEDLTAIGIAAPGVVDPDNGRVVVTPNMKLSGVEIGPRLEARFKVPVAVGNDCNLGTLGECWLGAARNARSAVGIFVGTGIGSGIVQDGTLWRGARESAAEIGHIVMQIGGPKCGCGNYGCLEALAGRSAIERDIRQAVEAGRQTVLTELLDGDLSIIRSSGLRRALDREDELVTDLMRRASEVLGHACLTVRHLIDPEVIVLGGGVVEACGDFILPIVQEIVGSDQLPGAREGGQLRLSALGDDAVVLGAVVLARGHVGRCPFKESLAVKPTYPRISEAGFGQLTVGEETYERDILITADGKVKNRKKGKAKKLYGTSHVLGPEELKKVCQGGPEVLFIGTGYSGQLQVTEQSGSYLRQRSIECRALPTPKVVEAYNSCQKRKAALIHVTC